MTLRRSGRTRAEEDGGWGVAVGDGRHVHADTMKRTARGLVSKQRGSAQSARELRSRDGWQTRGILFAGRRRERLLWQRPLQDKDLRRSQVVVCGAASRRSRSRFCCWARFRATDSGFASRYCFQFPSAVAADGAILLDPGRASAFGSGSGAAVARTCPNTRSARDEIGMARILAGRNGNTAGASLEPGPVTESRVLECKSSTGKRSAEASRSGGHRRLSAT